MEESEMRERTQDREALAPVVALLAKSQHDAEMFRTYGYQDLALMLDKAGECLGEFLLKEGLQPGDSYPAGTIDGLTPDLARLGSASSGSPNNTPGKSEPEDDQLLTAKEVAERLNVSVRWVYDHKNSDLRTVRRRPGRHTLRFSRHALEKWLATR